MSEPEDEGMEFETGKFDLAKTEVLVICTKRSCDRKMSICFLIRQSPDAEERIADRLMAADRTFAG